MVTRIRPTAISVKPLSDYRLYVEFDNGQRGIYDVKPYFSGAWFRELLDVEKFNQVHVGGLSVEWPSGHDLCPDRLYEDCVMENLPEDNRIFYMGYMGDVAYSEIDGVYHGKVLDIKPLISYEGATIGELIQDFHDGVDSYLDLCEELGEQPERPLAMCE